MGKVLVSHFANLFYNLCRVFLFFPVKAYSKCTVVLILCIFMAINMISSELAQRAIRFLKQQQQHTSHGQAANVAGVKAGNLLEKKKYISRK